MDATKNPRPTIENHTIHNALSGDPEAIQRTLQCLGSANPGLRRIITAAIRNMPGVEIWYKLLHCLALHRWDNQMDEIGPISQPVWQRIEGLIIKIFTIDHGSDCSVL